MKPILLVMTLATGCIPGLWPIAIPMAGAPATPPGTMHPTVVRSKPGSLVRCSAPDACSAQRSL